MSVYTTIEHAELGDFLGHYSVGELVDYAGILEGIENTNYFVDTSEGRFVLTIFEQHGFDELRYFLGLMHHVADRGVPSADPVADNNGAYLRTFKGKPAALVKRLAGGSLSLPGALHCRQLGDALGRLHTAGLSFEGRMANPRGPHWRAETAHRVIDRLHGEDRRLLADEIDFERRHRDIDIPRGVIHADLFRDNALWDDDRLGGIIDFYYACDDALLYDLAIVANDWCRDTGYRLDRERTVALLAGYHAQRPLTAGEQAYWPLMLRSAALRFWLSRLYDRHFPRDGEIVTQKNPDEFRAILRDRIENHDTYGGYWVCRA